MKKMIIMLAITIAACNSDVNTSEQEKKQDNEATTTATGVEQEKGKWKADEATKSNVAAMMQIVSDSSYYKASKAKELHSKLQAKVDMLIKQCTMKGPEHDALHVWLEKVLKDLKELEKEPDEYDESVAELKEDIGSFYENFE